MRTRLKGRFLKAAPFDDRRRRGLRAPDGRPVCRWCGKPVPAPRRAWCTENCQDEFMTRHSGTWARWRLGQRDKGICSACGMDTTALLGRLEAIHRRSVGLGRTAGSSRDRINRVFRRMGYDPGHATWDADHHVPVGEGGGVCALDNYRTLCVRCHKAKNAEEAGKTDLLNKKREQPAWTDADERDRLGPMEATIATVRKKVIDLKPGPYNEALRAITDEQLAALERSMDAFGFLEAIVWNERTGQIVHGHQKHKILLRRGVAETDVIAIEVSPMREKTINAAMNKLGGEFNPAGLAELLEEIGPEDRALTGFDEDEYEKLLDQAGQVQEPEQGRTDPDALPEEDEIEPRTRPGDLWRLGDHRLYCGDATNPADISFALDSGKPAMMMTDPPYGVELDHAWRNDVVEGCNTKRGGPIQGDTRADWGEVYPLVGAPILYVWHASHFGNKVQNGLEEAGYEVRQQIIWLKPSFVFGRGHYHWQHEPCMFAVHRAHAPQEPPDDVPHEATDDEIQRWADRHDLHYHEAHQPCWYAVKKGNTAEWKGDRRQTTVWEETSPLVTGGTDDAATLHPTQKPVGVYERPIRNHTRKGDLIFDAFMGSGTALIAATRLGRRCFGVEIDPRFCDMAVTRWQNFTGEKATRVAEDGSTEEFDAREIAVTPAEAGTEGESKSEDGAPEASPEGGTTEASPEGGAPEASPASP